MFGIIGSLSRLADTRIAASRTDMPISLDANGEPIGLSLPQHLSFEAFGATPLLEHSAEELHNMAVEEGREAAQTFDESLSQLQVLVRSCAAVTLLSHFAYYDTAYYENYTDRSEYQPAAQHNVELLQALILAVHESELTDAFPSKEQRMAINQLLKSAGTGFAKKRLTQESGLATIIREQARTGTQMVRNPGSQGQILRNLKELFSPLDELLLQSKGVTFSGLIALCEGYMAQVMGRLNSYRQAMQECFAQTDGEQMIRIYVRNFGLSDNELEYFLAENARQCTTPEQTKTALMNDSERIHPMIFSASSLEIASFYTGAARPGAIKNAMSAWSLKFGALAQSNPEHLFLNNPVWKKPFIEVSDDRYFWPVFSTFVSFGLEMLEAQMGDDEALKTAYHDRRAQYTEDKAALLLRDFGPGARMFRNLGWHDARSGKDFENDILILIDTHALIIECKSGRIKDTARRGARSLEENLKKLIQEPTEQGYGFEQFLSQQSGPIVLRDGSDVKHVIDGSSIARYTRLNVLLDFWGPIACQHKLLHRAGMLTSTVPPAVSLSIVDLENILYVIDSPGQRLHYLHRRAALEKNYEILGDELDLLAYYLGGGRWPVDTATKINLAWCSKALDPFLLRRDLDLSRKVPTLKLNKWWTDVIDRAEAILYKGWTETIMVFLSFPYDNQEAYWKYVESTVKDTVRSPAEVEGRQIICAAYPTPSELVGIGTHVTTRGTRAENRSKLELALNALGEMEPKPEAVIAVVVFPDSDPYNILGSARGALSTG